MRLIYGVHCIIMENGQIHIFMQDGVKHTKDSLSDLPKSGEYIIHFSDEANEISRKVSA